MSEKQIEFPEKLGGLFEPHRYKVAHGGRGGGKSWAFARALLILGARQPLRILCTREVQKSIRDSVHKLLGDQVQALGLGAFYEIQQTTIKGRNGSEFLFSGLSDQTSESIKSFESIDICWVEEAQAVTGRSWNILIPTIRKDSSEIWVSFNPELDTDETYTRFVGNPPPDALVVQMNYADNPWHGQVLEKERIHAKATMLDADYQNIWEGVCKPAVTGAIYAGEIADVVTTNRVCSVQYDPAMKVHAIFDLGWNDKMALVLVQRHLSELRVIEYIEDSHKTLDWYSAELLSKRLNWGSVWLPHDGAHKDYKTGKSAQQIMQELGWTVEIVPNMAVEQGIRTARMAFPRIWFDKAKTDRLIQCLRRYRRGVPVTTGEPGNPVHDEWSHGADALRYLCIVADRLSNEAFGGKLNYPNLGIV